MFFEIFSTSSSFIVCFLNLFFLIRIIHAGVANKNNYRFLYLFFITVERKIICRATIIGIKGIFQSKFIQLIFTKKSTVENRIPVMIMILWGLVFSLCKLAEECCSIKFMLCSDDFVLLFVSIV